MSGEGGGGSESQQVTVVGSLGTCIWCGHSLIYQKPGNPPYDAITDKIAFYEPSNVRRDYSLIDTPLVYGKFCPLAPPHPLGQFTVHQLVSNPQQP